MLIQRHRQTHSSAGGETDLEPQAQTGGAELQGAAGTDKGHYNGRSPCKVNTGSHVSSARCPAETSPPEAPTPPAL